MRRIVLIIFSVVVLVACGGGDDNAQVQQNTRPATQIRNFPTTAPTVAMTATPTSAFATIGNQNPQTGCTIPSGWQAYFVRFGDTLSGLATTTGSTVNVIQQGNCLSGVGLAAQQLLFLPSLPAGVPTVNPASLSGLVQQPTSATGGIVVPTNTSTAVNCPFPPNWAAYIVQSGDTLADLATRTNTTVGNIQNGNCLGTSELIFAGQTLYLPRTPDAVATTVPVATTTPNATCAVPFGWQAYTVQSGDTLGIIADTYNTTVANLQNGNCLGASELIFAGQTLYVPPVGGIAITSTPTPTATPALTFPQPSATPTATSTTSSIIGVPDPLPAPVIRPTQTRDDGALVTLQPTIELDVGVVNDADLVRYLAAVDPQGTGAVQIGVDETPFDGTRVTYEINEFDSDLYIYAVAENTAGSSSSSIVHLVYDPTFNLNVGQPVITPFVGFDGSIYIVEVGSTVTVSWSGAPSNATRVDFFVREQSNERLIGTDTTPADGARIVWNIQQAAAGELLARATLPTGATTDSETVFISAETTEE